MSTKPKQDQLPDLRKSCDELSIAAGLVVSHDVQMSKWQIRPANARDARALSECIKAAYSIYASRVTDLPAVAEGISGDIKNHRVWVAEIDQNIVGGIILISHDDFVLLANVAVHPDSSGLGLGSALINLAEAECLNLGLHELRLSTHVDIPENVRLYTYLGWQETGRTGNKIHMRKVLDGSSR